MDTNLLKELCEVFAPSGDEVLMKEFILNYVEEHQSNWKVQPEVIATDQLQDCLILRFGKPRTAVFAHMDSIGFTVRYQDQLIPIGSPDVKDGYPLVGHDALGPILCKLKVQEQKKDKKKKLHYTFGRGISSGTNLVFECDFKDKKKYITSCFLDNRLGIYNILKLAESLEDGLLVFSCWEEQGGGAVPFLLDYIMKHHPVQQCLIADITWVTEGVKHGEGAVISLRDRNIPRRSFVNKLIQLAGKSDIPFQLEVEGEGSSDGREIQQSPYPLDWCFVGVPIANTHTPHEKVQKKDIESYLNMYHYLMRTL
ncbi:zinc-binding metallopeptidase family protein [Catalinimonas niigatensis]|uniref:aminopeptidase n=1 Tax=Catalinimonas niigatensis TaxID=1397264 RepID=UPI0026650FE1|nr:aminopeptidase [Catalinimonas niigatensis]WPP50110.1 aminopeptidase [Catalinimonas niigatensis]